MGKAVKKKDSDHKRDVYCWACDMRFRIDNRQDAVCPYCRKSDDVIIRQKGRRQPNNPRNLRRRR
ncbi:MAG: hypothetical protein WCT16_04185 [Candidatus Buchananbacteria bacterium]